MKSLDNETNDACSKSNNWTSGRAKKNEWEKCITGLFECQISFPKKYFHTYLFDLATHLRKIGFPQNWPWFPLHREREREDLFNKRNFHQLYANNGEISRKYQKGTKGTNIEGSSYYMIWTVDFRTRTGSYLTFSLDQQPSSSFTKFMSATMSTSMVTTSIINLSMSMSIYQGP